MYVLVYFFYLYSFFFVYVQNNIFPLQILGTQPKFWTVPVGIFDAIIGLLSSIGKMFPSFEDAAELGRIGKYYAVEDMLTTDSKEKFGKITLRQHYERIKVEGQEYDPYTTMLGSKKQ